MTPGQRKALHALVERLGIHRGMKVSVHDAVRIICGVDSCKLISHSLASRMINILKEDKPERGRFHGPTIGATKRQRAYIRALAVQCEWSQVKLAGWLKSHAGIENLDARYVVRDDARSAIDQLQNILAKLADERGWTFRRTDEGHELIKPEAHPATEAYS